jgi:hypothetical protein
LWWWWWWWWWWYTNVSEDHAATIFRESYHPEDCDFSNNSYFKYNSYNEEDIKDIKELVTNNGKMFQFFCLQRIVILRCMVFK